MVCLCPFYEHPQCCCANHHYLTPLPYNPTTSHPQPHLTPTPPLPKMSINFLCIPRSTCLTQHCPCIAYCLPITHPPTLDQRVPITPAVKAPGGVHSGARRGALCVVRGAVGGGGGGEQDDVGGSIVEWWRVVLCCGGRMGVCMVEQCACSQETHHMPCRSVH